MRNIGAVHQIDHQICLPHQPLGPADSLTFDCIRTLAQPCRIVEPDRNALNTEIGFDIVTGGTLHRAHD
ncbi:hypothetical protein SDC9_131138 [bioreactor metagenome]|uniref:Uncharacterized protein n=1 Tax=bioreactor metagenome TaxID=1076179 RepID=A0A645D4G2_9ZZZZ